MGTPDSKRKMENYLNIQVGEYSSISVLLEKICQLLKPLMQRDLPSVTDVLKENGLDQPRQF